VGKLIRPFVAWQDLLTYLRAILRVYNLHGRRDNKYKARIKILVKDLTPEGFTEQVEQEWAHLKDGPDRLTQADLDKIADRFTWPEYDPGAAQEHDPTDTLAAADPAFGRWLRKNVNAHRVAGYASVTLSLKPTGTPPGDVTADQMDAIADLADDYSFGEMRVSHEQNLILPDVRRSRLYELWNTLKPLKLATANIGLLTNIISCPGGDFCALANAVSIPVAEAIQRRFDSLDYLFEIGELDLNISGCINACGHHHVGHIGILGVDKAGEEWYQVTIGGRQNGAGDNLNDFDPKRAGGAAIGRIIGPSFARDEIPDVVEKLIHTYLRLRDSEEERFVDVVGRVGIDPFKAGVYGEAEPQQTGEAAHA
jgi:sulfite reductase (NADPH) hemoprotein beta-component